MTMCLTWGMGREREVGANQREVSSFAEGRGHGGREGRGKAVSLLFSVGGLQTAAGCQRKERAGPEDPALAWGSLRAGELVEWSLGDGRGAGRGCLAGTPPHWLPIAESTQETDPTSARILAAKRLSLSFLISR